MSGTLDSNASRSLDRRIIESGISGYCLMMRAARSAFDRLMVENPTSVICVAGAGNNGGDAYGVAAFLMLSGIPVTVVSLASSKGDALKARHFYEDLGGFVLDRLPTTNQWDWIIDGILGTGCDRPPEGSIADAITWINNSRSSGARVMSLDVPSGLNASTGEAFDPVVCADVTVTFLAEKTGNLTGEGPAYAGLVHLEKLEPWNVQPEPLHTRLVTDAVIDLPRQKDTAHKGIRGSVLVVGGRHGMEGAGQLSGLAALRTGAGKVFWATDAPQFDVPELIRIPWDIGSIVDCASRCQSVVVGPGLGNDAGDVIAALWDLDIPLVVDADALNWLSQHKLSNRQSPWIGTPHPLEAKRLTGLPMADRFSMLHALEALYDATWVLKGAGTLISGQPPWLNPVANAALGTAGSGDVLAGIIASLWAQGSQRPAVTGVWLHANAFLKALAERGPDVIASDAVDRIGRIKTA